MPVFISAGAGCVDNHINRVIDQISTDAICKLTAFYRVGKSSIWKLYKCKRFDETNYY